MGVKRLGTSASMPRWGERESADEFAHASIFPDFIFHVHPSSRTPVAQEVISAEGSRVRGVATSQIHWSSAHLLDAHGHDHLAGAFEAGRSLEVTELLLDLRPSSRAASLIEAGKHLMQRAE